MAWMGIVVHLCQVYPSQVASTSEKDLTCMTSAISLRLPIPTIQKSFTLQISADPTIYIEVENDFRSVGGSKLSQLKCNRDGKEWRTVLTSRILAAAGSNEMVCVACEKRMLSMFSSSGRRVFPPIILPSQISTIQCTGRFVMALTSSAALSVWDVHNQKAVIKNESLLPILTGNDLLVSQTLLTQRGVPVLSLSNGKAYCFNPALSTWRTLSALLRAEQSTAVRRHRASLTFPGRSVKTRRGRHRKKMGGAGPDRRGNAPGMLDAQHAEYHLDCARINISSYLFPLTTFILHFRICTSCVNRPLPVPSYTTSASPVFPAVLASPVFPAILASPLFPAVLASPLFPAVLASPLSPAVLASPLFPAVLASPLSPAVQPVLCFLPSLLPVLPVSCLHQSSVSCVPSPQPVHSPAVLASPLAAACCTACDCRQPSKVLQ
ncbi:unnamed protein product [Ranitomeya imitator]|uniref:Protein HIRA-like C-terminal domain-containing protein n=1 Tax=Ranitomeya imitator TaxID=111125 RepID=A0ABN9MHJ2_9NEOB|nr:unnamed protein product [Ranitomeya imitator]